MRCCDSRSDFHFTAARQFSHSPVYLCHVHNEAGGGGAEASSEQVPSVSQSEARTGRL